MSDAKIVHAGGGLYSSHTYLLCTGCGETFKYSWRQWKGDFSGNISDYEQFLNWADWEARKHDCFSAGGRAGYLTPSSHKVDFPQAERHEDPWGGVGYVEEPEEEDPFDFDSNCPTCGMSAATFVDGDCPACNPPIEDEDDDLDAWMDEELDLPSLADELNAKDAEQGLHESDNYDWAKVCGHCLTWPCKYLVLVQEEVNRDREDKDGG